MRRYWLAWLNEIGKLALCLLFAYGALLVWFCPESSNDKLLGIAIGILFTIAIFLLTDLIFSVWAIRKGTHKLLKSKSEAMK